MRNLRLTYEFSATLRLIIGNKINKIIFFMQTEWTDPKNFIYFQKWPENEKKIAYYCIELLILSFTY